MQEVPYPLPRTLNLDEIKQRRKPKAAECFLCETKFTRQKLVGADNAVRHCKLCARAVCQDCSEGRKQLSLDNPRKERVCDECDALIENYHIVKRYE